MVASGTKLKHQILDKVRADIINVNDKLKENVKDIGELNQSIQMFQDINDKIDNSIKQKKSNAWHMSKVYERNTMNELKEKAQNLEDRYQRGNPRIGGITILGKILVRHRGIT